MGIDQIEEVSHMQRPIIDTMTLMLTMTKLRRIERLPAFYEELIKHADNSRARHKYTAKRDAYAREVSKLRMRLRGASY